MSDIEGEGLGCLLFVLLDGRRAEDFSEDGGAGQGISGAPSHRSTNPTDVFVKPIQRYFFRALLCNKTKDELGDFRFLQDLLGPYGKSVRSVSEIYWRS